MPDSTVVSTFPWYENKEKEQNKQIGLPVAPKNVHRWTKENEILGHVKKEL
jgi:hypothetical protein